MDGVAGLLEEAFREPTHERLILDHLHLATGGLFVGGRCRRVIVG
jgi:hypothetical protein